MAGPEARASALEDGLDEEGHYYDFLRFYKRGEVCDRNIRLKILDESKEGPEAAGCEEIPVSSIVLAAKSLVLQKMIFAGMQESDKGAPMSIKVTAEEKEAFKEMLHFLYAGSLSPRLHDPATDVREVVRLLVVGDKFEVPSLMGAVLKCLSKREKSIPDSAVLVEQLPETLFQIGRIKKVADEARAHIIEAFKDVSMTWNSEIFEFFESNPNVMEILLQSEELEADSEEEILEKALSWIRGCYQSESERRHVVSKLLPQVRFFCLSGEYLERLLAVPEMQSKPTQALINAALRFRAYSDAKKEVVRKAFVQRKGVREVHLEIINDFVLGDQRTRMTSRSALWFGKKWYIMLSRKGDSVRTVGVFLCCEVASDSLHGSSSTVDDVETKFFVKIWPEGIWKSCGSVGRTALNGLLTGGKLSGCGPGNPLKTSWADARRSERLLGSTGAVTIRVVARRFQSSEDSQQWAHQTL
ncbi:BTB/POZ/Kelch-associated protein [Klebsormidium nitens]|uniref:BTB/POZ/Kelch-associated protein n=1 Tax=Klebsormidium nitens TaxID=105231 RepID=A0A1Y1IED2_KLENI|nr:BTB/POZ/Kelch-associated protein [Klebsormidium nitens]|eukprot:GAQ88322.1 BTB/POZ/Kelch-associated protein [Klebsormidium nitens]